MMVRDSFTPSPHYEQPSHPPRLAAAPFFSVCGGADARVQTPPTLVVNLSHNPPQRFSPCPRPRRRRWPVTHPSARGDKFPPRHTRRAHAARAAHATPMSATTSSSNTATKSVSSAYSKALEESAEFSFKEGNEEAGASASASFGYKLTTSATNTVENVATTLQGTQNGTITGTSVECPAGNLFQLQFSSPTNAGGESALLNSMWRCIPNVAPSFGPGASCPNSYPCCIDPTYCAGKDACCNECHPSNDGGNPTIPYYGCTDYETSKTCTVDDPSSCSWACPDLSGSLDGGSIGSHTRQQWLDTIDANLNAGRQFYIGLPQTWWYGKTASETKNILQTCHPAAGQ